MSRDRPFLEAEWRHLALFNYEVDPDLLEPFVPAGTELDAWEACLDAGRDDCGDRPSLPVLPHLSAVVQEGTRIRTVGAVVLGAIGLYMVGALVTDVLVEGSRR